MRAHADSCVHRLHFLALTVIFITSGCSDEGPSGAPDAGGLPVDQCLGATDEELILSLEPDGGAPVGDVVGVLGMVGDCARGPCYDEFINEGDVAGCIDTCLDETEASPISDPCRVCFIETLACVQSDCLVICLGEDRVACQACMDANCFPRHDACTGVERP